MAELTFNKLADAPVLDKVPDGAKVYAEVDGKVYRVAGDNLGGGVPTAIIEVSHNGASEVGPMATAAESESAEETPTATENEATPPAVGIAKGVATYNVSDSYTGVCTNMTYAKAKAILEAGKPLMAVVLSEDDYDNLYATLADKLIYLSDEEYIVINLAPLYLYWLPDDTITGTEWEPDQE